MNRDSLALCVALIVIVLFATSVSIAGGVDGVRVGPIPVFTLCGALAFAINWLAFIPANAAKTEHFYDITGTVTYLAVIAAAVLMVPALDARAKLAALMVVGWALRLGVFLYLRIRKDGQDDRFNEIKVKPLRFFLVWSLQALWVLLTVACALVIIAGNSQKGIGVVGSIGIVMWLLGFIVEVVADAQKRIFRHDPVNNGCFINTGLWSWSRHPNYFGEILLWFGMAVLAIPILTGWQWVVITSPFFVTLLLTRVSGIPILKKKAHERWGNDADYQAYVSKTSLLIPRPPFKT